LNKGKHHGTGIYRWQTGGKYVGAWKNGRQWCGVENTENGSFVFINGDSTKQEVGVNWGDTLLLVLAAGAAAAVVDAAADSSGGSYPSTVTDYDWDWDAFKGQYGNRLWRCRGIQSGRFAEDERCQYDTKVDDRWPNN